MIRTLKLVTGDEVVGRVVENTDHIIITQPRTFQVIQDSSGQVRAGLVPWFMSDPDAEVVIKEKHIIAMIVTTKQLEDAYLQQTTGLDLSAANGSKIVV